MNIRPLTSAVGAEVDNIDLSRQLDLDTADALRRAFLEHSVLVIRGQRLSEDQFIRLSRGFGPIEPYESTVKEFLKPGYPEIIVLSNIERNGKPIGIRDAGQYWHTDRSYVAQPAWSSLLYSIKIPVDSQGRARGATQFSGTIAAFAALSEPLKDQLRRLKAVHRYIYRYTKAPDKPLPGVVHPVVLTHPYTGRESLYVNSGFTERIDGMSEGQSKQLLAELFRHISQPRFVYTHQWEQGDVVMWDNFATQHNAVSDYELPMERLIWRTTVRAPAT